MPAITIKRTFEKCCPDCILISFSLTASRLKLAPGCMGGKLSAVYAGLAASCWTKTNRQNSNVHQSLANNDSPMPIFSNGSGRRLKIPGQSNLTFAPPVGPGKSIGADMSSIARKCIVKTAVRIMFFFIYLPKIGFLIRDGITGVIWILNWARCPKSSGLTTDLPGIRKIECEKIEHAPLADVGRVLVLAAGSYFPEVVRKDPGRQRA